MSVLSRNFNNAKEFLDAQSDIFVLSEKECT